MINTSDQHTCSHRQRGCDASSNVWLQPSNFFHGYVLQWAARDTLVHLTSRNNWNSHWIEIGEPLTAIDKLMYASTLPFLRPAAILCFPCTYFWFWCTRLVPMLDIPLRPVILIWFIALPLLDSLQNKALMCVNCNMFPVNAAICLICGTYDGVFAEWLLYW